MTVKELIELLEQVEDKDKKVMIDQHIDLEYFYDMDEFVNIL